MVCEVCGQNPLVRAKKAFFGKKPFLGRVAFMSFSLRLHSRGKRKLKISNPGMLSDILKFWVAFKIKEL